MSPTEKIIHEKLTEALAPTHLEIINDSEMHRGHAGHDGSGESHFTVIIQSEEFRGKNRLAQQRLVMAALKQELKERIHALAVKTSVPD